MLEPSPDVYKRQVTGSVIYKLIVAFVIRQNLFGDKSANLMKLTCALDVYKRQVVNMEIK